MVFVDNKIIRKFVHRKQKENKAWLSNYIEDISRAPVPSHGVLYKNVYINHSPL